MPAQRPKRGALPSTRSALAAATPHRALVGSPPQFINLPKRLSWWGNNDHGTCVSAEEAFAKGCGSPDIFVSDADVIAWATRHGVLEGAHITDVMKWMQEDGYQPNSYRYNDGPYLSVDWRDGSTVRSAICQGPVKLGVASDQIEDAWSTTGGSSGWFGLGFHSDTALDHCVSLCGYGSLRWLADQLHVTLPPGVDGAKSGYAMFTWNSIGIVDEASMVAVTTEAWLRRPTTVVSYKGPAQTNWGSRSSAAGSRVPEHLDVFFAGKDGSVQTQWWNQAPGAGWADHQHFPIAPAGSVAGANVTAVARTAVHLDVFWVTPEGAVATQWWDEAANQGWGDHQPFTITPPGVAAPGSSVAAVARLPGHLDVFWIGPDGSIRSQWWDQQGQSWSDHSWFAITPPNVASGTQLAAVARVADHLDVFWIGPDGSVRTQWWDQPGNQGWDDHAWFAITPPGVATPGSSISAVARVPGHLDVFWIGPDGSIRTQWWDQPTNQGWDAHPHFPITPPGEAALGSGISSVARFSGHLDVFWVGPDGSVRSQWWDQPTNQNWNDHGPFALTAPNAAALSSNVASVARFPEHLDVFWTAPDGSVHSQWWDQAPNQSWANHSMFPITPPAVAKS